MKPTASRIPTEHEEQAAVVAWCEATYGKYSIFAIPNMVKCSFATASYLRKEGKRPGVPDLMIPGKHGPFLGLFIEMKRMEGGKVSEEQAAWIAALERMGYAVHVCEGADEAMRIIKAYKDPFK